MALVLPARRGVVAALWIVGVRDWRCHVLAVTSPVVVHGLVLREPHDPPRPPVALAWRYRDKARVAGLALGVAVAAKLFVWPLVVWLLLTRRFRAAAWAVGVGGRPRPRRLGADRLRGARRLSGAAPRGAGRLRDPERLALDRRRCARRLRRRGRRGRRASRASLLPRRSRPGSSRATDGDRRAFAVVVAACIVASPIVWPNYAALLFVPIAITWPRLAPAWFFGYASGSWGRSRRGRPRRTSAAGRQTCPSRRGVGATRTPSSGTRPASRWSSSACDRDAAGRRAAGAGRAASSWRRPRVTRRRPGNAWQRRAGPRAQASRPAPPPRSLADRARAGAVARRRGRPLDARSRLDRAARAVALDPARRDRLLGAREEHRRGAAPRDPRRAGVRLGRGVSDVDRAGLGALRRPGLGVPRGARDQRARDVVGRDPAYLLARMFVSRRARSSSRR